MSKTITIPPFTYEKTLSPLESKPKLETEDSSSPTPSIETFKLINDSKIDIYNIINKRSAISESKIDIEESYNYWKDWDCKTHQFTNCANLYSNIANEYKPIIFFIGFRTMIYGDHLHDFGSSKVYTSGTTNQEKLDWSKILFKGCLKDIKWFITQSKIEITDQTIINILKYLLLNQFTFWFKKTIKLSTISQEHKDVVTKKYKEQRANICSITTLDDYIKIFKYIDFCGYYCGKFILEGASSGRNEDREKQAAQEIQALHDEMGKFICNWTLKSIFCIYTKSLKNLLGCDQEKLAQNFIVQNKNIFIEIYGKEQPKNSKETMIQLRIDQEGDTRNHLAIFNSITDYTRQYITCENINVGTDDDDTGDSNNIINELDNAALYISKILYNKANKNLGIIYDYAGWQDPGCSTLPRLRSDLKTLYELQILVPKLDKKMIYYFATIPIIRYTYYKDFKCSYDQFFEHTFRNTNTALKLSNADTSVDSIKTRAKGLLGRIDPENQANIITSNLTIKTFGDLNQCIIFGHYYGNHGFYLNQDKNCLPIFMTGDIICGYMSALFSNQVITEKHDKSSTMRKRTRELVDGVIYYLNCTEIKHHREYLDELKNKMINDVAAAVAEDSTYLNEFLSDTFDYICPRELIEEGVEEGEFEEALEELEELEELPNPMDTDDTKPPSTKPPSKKRQRVEAGVAEGQKGKQTYKNKVKRAYRTKRTNKVKRANKVKRTKRAKRANKVKRAYRTKRTNKVIKTNTTQ